MVTASVILVGVQVIDEAGYARYRAEMRPLLEAHGGSFIVDVRLAEVLRAPRDLTFNRLFTIRFPSATHRDAFFADPAYLVIRRRWFEPSVSNTVRLGEYEVSNA